MEKFADFIQHIDIEINKPIVIKILGHEKAVVLTEFVLNKQEIEAIIQNNKVMNNCDSASLMFAPIEQSEDQKTLLKYSQKLVAEMGVKISSEFMLKNNIVCKREYGNIISDPILEFDFWLLG